MSLRTPLVEHPEQLREGCEAVEASMALTPGALGFAEVEEVDCQFFRFLGTMLRDLGIERLSLQPTRQRRTSPTFRRSQPPPTAATGCTL